MVNLQNKPIVIGTPIEIDFAVNEIRKDLANIEWISHPYFIAQKFTRKIDGRSFLYPETYAPKKPGSNEYHRLTPDNDYKGMIFFLVGKGVNDFNANQYNFITYPVSIICSVNLKLIDDCKYADGLFTQELIKDVRRSLTTNMMNYDSFDYNLIDETRDLREVYREFVLDDLEQYNRAPMQCFRFDLSVRIEEDCD